MFKEHSTKGGKIAAVILILFLLGCFLVALNKEGTIEYSGPTQTIEK
tara:strand:+ start:626 stop:766 length:141 start_codon:yes stop_codon:yes gene_type:complete